MSGNFNTAIGADVLGAHNGYGRGCVMCHAPHSGSAGNHVTPGTNSLTGQTSDPNNGMYALWGQDLTPLYGQTFNFSGDGNSPGANYPVTLPTSANLNSLFQQKDASVTVLFCLSCHDGTLAKGGMMTGVTVEALPIVGGTAPTLLGSAAPANGTAYNNDHPVGVNAVVTCNSATFSYGWDCTGGGAVGITMNGTASKIFVGTDYKASFWSTTKAVSLASANGGAVVTAVTCTTCHDQHSMTVYKNGTGAYPTMFFIKGEYAPTTGGNSVAQFCRNCHGGESNEMKGLTVPTT
jgi:cytochrome c5